MHHFGFRMVNATSILPPPHLKPGEAQAGLLDEVPGQPGTGQGDGEGGEERLVDRQPAHHGHDRQRHGKAEQVGAVGQVADRTPQAAADAVSDVLGL